MASENSCILCRGVKTPCINEGDLMKACQRCHQLDLPCAYSKKRRRLKASEKASTGSELPVSLAETSSSSPPQLGNDGASTLHASSRHVPIDRRYSAMPGASSSYMSPTGLTGLRSDGSGSGITSTGAQALSSASAMSATLDQPPAHITPSQPLSPSYSNPASHSNGSVQRRSGVSQTSASAVNRTPSSSGSAYGHSPTAPPNPAPRIAGPSTSKSDTWVDLEMCTNIVVNPGEKVTPGAQGLGGASRRNMLEDPIMMGYLTEHEGERMFDLFYQYLNPEIALFDVEVHTFDFVRERSPLLFSAILGATAKFFNKESYPRIWGHTQRLGGRVVERGVCSVPIIQALLILVYWKQPNDRSAWMKIGLAVRMGYQLGWHNGWATPATEDPAQYWERLDAQRTWFALVTFDKTYAGVFNLPSTIRAHEFGDMEAWAYEHDHLDISNDLRMCCSLQTLIFMDSVTAWRAECRTMSKNHALLQMESLFERAVQLHTKWCNRGPNLPRGLGDRQKAFINFVLQHVIFLLRFAMLSFAPSNQIELILSDCVDRAMTYLDKLRIVADLGSWTFQQDIASAKMASFCATLQDLYFRVSPGQRHLVLQVLEDIHHLCCEVADDQPDAPMAFVARYTERLLSTMVTQTTASAPASRTQRPQPQPHQTHEVQIQPQPQQHTSQDSVSQQSHQQQQHHHQHQHHHQQQPQLQNEFIPPQQQPQIILEQHLHHQHYQSAPSMATSTTPTDTISIPPSDPPYTYTNIHTLPPQDQPYLQLAPKPEGFVAAPEMRPPLPPQAVDGPTDGLVFGDLSELLGMTGMLIGSNFAEEQYWSSLFASLPTNNDLLPL